MRRSWQLAPGTWALPSELASARRCPVTRLTCACLYSPRPAEYNDVTRSKYTKYDLRTGLTATFGWVPGWE